MLTVKNEEQRTDRQRQRQEAEEPRPDRRLRKSMDRTNHSTARQEGAKDRESKSREDQPHVPDLQHATLFLHHYRMEESRSGQPREERCILNRIPAPVSAPTEH